MKTKENRQIWQKPTSHLEALRKAKRFVDGYRKQLAQTPHNEFPRKWDSVLAAEVLSELAHELHTFDRGADIPAHGRKGIAHTPAFIGSFWPSVDMLLEVMPEPVAVRCFMDSAARLLAKDIEDMQS